MADLSETERITLDVLVDELFARFPAVRIYDSRRTSVHSTREDAREALGAYEFDYIEGVRFIDEAVEPSGVWFRVIYGSDEILDDYDYRENIGLADRIERRVAGMI